MLITSRRAGRPCSVFAWVCGMLAALLLSGCGGSSSQTVVATGFPADGQPHTLTAAGNTANDSLTLATPAAGVTTPIFFSAPKPATETSVPAPLASSGLHYIAGTAYQFSSTSLAFPEPITFTFQYASLPNNTDPATLNVYYYDGTTWQPVTPAAGHFSNLPSGQVTTTIQTIQPTGLYAVLSSQPPPSP